MADLDKLDRLHAAATAGEWDANDPEALPSVLGSVRASMIRALEATAAADPTALRQCVEAIAAALEAETLATPARVTGRRRSLAARRA